MFFIAIIASITIFGMFYKYIMTAYLPAISIFIFLLIAKI